MNILMVGRGRVGHGLRHALKSSGRVAAHLTSGRRPAPRALDSADVVVLTVPDGAIAEVARGVAARVRRGVVVLHCAGARATGDLVACADAGAHVGVMHPLVSFARPGRPPTLAGTSFVIGGAPRAVRAARDLAAAVGATAITADVHGPAYHAAAALVANGAAALATISVGVMQRLGIRRRPAERAVASLLRSVADNVDRVGLPEALTGPVRRGDGETLLAHRQALAAVDTVALRAYEGLAPVIIDCATRAGLGGDKLRAVRRAVVRRL